MARAIPATLRPAVALHNLSETSDFKLSLDKEVVSKIVSREVYYSWPRDTH